MTGKRHINVKVGTFHSKLDCFFLVDHHSRQISHIIEHARCHMRECISDSFPPTMQLDIGCVVKICHRCFETKVYMYVPERRPAQLILQYD